MAGVFKRRTAAGALVLTALAGGAAGAGVYGATAAPGTRVVTTTVNGSTALTAAAESGLSVNQIYTRNVRGVVEVTATTQGGYSPFGGSSSQQALGTGFVYDTSGHVVTNEHVVANADAVSVTFSDGTKLKATVVGSDPASDLAVLKVTAPASGLHPLALGDSSAVEVGDGVVAIGNPFGLDDTVTAGIVSAVGREITSPDNTPIENAIQTDAPINHGNSGGPLFDMQGNVVGVTSQIESDSGGSDGVGFAIPSATVKQVASQLIATGSVKHAQLGVQVQTIPSGAAATLGVPAGVAVAGVQSGSGAAAAGLHAATGTRSVDGTSYPTGGDVITAVEGTKVTTAEQLRGLIDGHGPGASVDLTVVRGGATRHVTVVLGTRAA